MVIILTITLKILVIAAIVIGVIYSIKYVKNVQKIDLKNKSLISFKESMDLLELPIVTFFSNGKKLHFLLDTGSKLSYINTEILQYVNYVDVGCPKEFFGIDGVKCTSTTCKFTVYYNDLTFEEEFESADLTKSFFCVKEETGIQIHGILGSKFFNKYKYVIDFKSLIAYKN